MRAFEELTNIEGVKEFIRKHPLSFLYISSPNCSVCHGLKPQVQNLMEKYPKVSLGFVNTQKIPEIAGLLSIFTVPALLFFVEGKEYIREARIVHLDLFDEKVDKIYQHTAY
jgi:thiol-disulfide isomerase/thioredoxin